LPVVLDDVHVVGCGKEARKRRRFRVPQRGRDNSILDKDIQALFDEKRRVQDNEAEAERQHIIAGADLEKRSNDSLWIASVSY